MQRSEHLCCRLTVLTSQRDYWTLATVHTMRFQMKWMRWSMIGLDLQALNQLWTLGLLSYSSLVVRTLPALSKEILASLSQTGFPTSAVNGNIWGNDRCLFYHCKDSMYLLDSTIWFPNSIVIIKHWCRTVIYRNTLIETYNASVIYDCCC